MDAFSVVVVVDVVVDVVVVVVVVAVVVVVVVVVVVIVSFYSSAQVVRGLIYPRRPSGHCTSVVTGVFPSALRYIPSFYRAYLAGFSISAFQLVVYARRFSYFLLFFILPRAG